MAEGPAIRLTIDLVALVAAKPPILTFCMYRSGLVRYCKFAFLAPGQFETITGNIHAW
jgi:hypothetical protein